jgi:hypothetical protein
MKILEIIEPLSLEIKSCNQNIESPFSGAYVSDLLSDVMAKGNDGELWITLQTHLNIVAVASVKGLSGIIVVNSRCPDQETLKRAEKEGILIAVTPLSCFEAAGRLYKIING